jgi:hypothetical protein
VIIRTKTEDGQPVEISTANVIGNRMVLALSRSTETITVMLDQEHLLGLGKAMWLQANVDPLSIALGEVRERTE